MQAIVAVSENWGIGKDNDLLFSIPEDKRYFRDMTLGKVVIMGRKTLESLPEGKPLKGRRNIVISGRQGYVAEGAETVTSPVQAAELVAGIPCEEVFVVGGGEVYRAMLPFCERALVTKVFSSPEADRFFPDLDNTEGWSLVSQSKEREYEGLRYVFCEYKRK